MNRQCIRSTVLFALVSTLPWPACSHAADAIGPPLTERIGSGISFRNEVQRSIDKGLAWLAINQNSNGWWSTPDHPSVTALALSAFMGEPTGRYKKNPSPHIQRGYTFLLACVKPDGSIYQTTLINYNTSISMMALLAAGEPKYNTVLRKARAYLANTQVDIGRPGKIDSPFDGGIGYGSKYNHSDLNNTLTALEAMFYSKHLAEDQNLAGARDLNWEAAIHFIQSCQNLPGYNTQSWVSADAKNKGGFVYYPGQSMAGAETNSTTGKVALRSYGSISYAGLLSYIYANLKRDDPRVVAVMDWLRANYTLEENPRMGPQGLYYYLHLMTKALNISGVRTLTLNDGRNIDWRNEVALHLINLQKPDGSWLNENGRWWERDPHLVTAYCVLSLEIIYRGL